MNAPKLEKLPEGLPPGPMREAMELANEATFTELEIEAYRKVMDEIGSAVMAQSAKDVLGFE